MQCTPFAYPNSFWMITVWCSLAFRPVSELVWRLVSFVGGKVHILQTCKSNVLENPIGSLPKSTIVIRIVQLICLLSSRLVGIDLLTQMAATWLSVIRSTIKWFEIYIYVLSLYKCRKRIVIKLELYHYICYLHMKRSTKK